MERKQVTIPAITLLKFARNAIKFPYSQICKHLVAADLLDELEKQGFLVDENFELASKTVVQARDVEAIEVLTKLIEREEKNDRI